LLKLNYKEISYVYKIVGENKYFSCYVINHPFSHF